MQRPGSSRAPGPPAFVSIILPVHNAEEWLDECLKSVLQQDFEGSMELSVFDDASKDKSMSIIGRWKEKLEGAGIPVVIGGHDSPSPRGVGYSKNQAVAQSSGSYLCFLDSVFTSHGPTVVMPTWFCARAWFYHVGLFDEGGQGVPEDLLFFYEHLRKGGGVMRVDQSLLLYRYHPRAATHSVLQTTIWTHRVRFLEEQALPQWATFTIWNAGKQGRRLYRSLTAASRHKVVAFCDVDENKMKKGFYCHEDAQERPKPRVPILHFRAARPPFVICVKLAGPLAKFLFINTSSSCPSDLASVARAGWLPRSECGTGHRAHLPGPTALPLLPMDVASPERRAGPVLSSTLLVDSCAPVSMQLCPLSGHLTHSGVSRSVSVLLLISAASAAFLATLWYWVAPDWTTSLPSWPQMTPPHRIQDGGAKPRPCPAAHRTDTAPSHGDSRSPHSGPLKGTVSSREDSCPHTPDS
ncbi:UDP-GlcNAc:betaGal beta-1,3-N-acetylglucosaminyltransferase-like protein 1 isoform X5 [Heterocephalus glaber]|uniref:UDP-GlcNAc:betaGal beta-1,3-N-acetylglucosaminyltransferase-like protein 1 isoform X5 n=1 Tax=Heterocephalus glaber TaxID=10181 RepID=A0AAX6RJV8_HETGA|nr:UDP-GlcNAc:betaGal beta-1,3-N-acetylglucosaminyltransferase-like protein 1 isoform X5 [Heterocephalus glaber]